LDIGDNGVVAGTMLRRGRMMVRDLSGFVEIGMAEILVDRYRCLDVPGRQGVFAVRSLTVLQKLQIFLYLSNKWVRK
jgi:hypothetical protein